MFDTDVTLEGGADDVWIFQVDADLSAGSGAHVIQSGGELAKKVFWQVASIGSCEKMNTRLCPISIHSRKK